MIKISNSEIPHQLFTQYCIAIECMGKLRTCCIPGLLVKMYSEMDERRRDLHEQLLEYVKDDEGFAFALAIEIEAILNSKIS